jgi:hypothetical protein
MDGELGPGPFAWPFWVIAVPLLIVAMCSDGTKDCNNQQAQIDQLRFKVQQLENGR